VPDYSDPAHYEEASDVAAELALLVGFILIVLSLLNLGNIIRYVSFSVISGFTSGAACVIGLNQLRSAFGFSNSGVPQQGQPGFDYNYQVMRWFRVHFYDRYHFTAAQLTKPTGLEATSANIIVWKTYLLREGELYINQYAIQICFSLFCALMLVIWIKAYFKETPERKKKVAYRTWFLLSALCPFIGIIIAGKKLSLMTLPKLSTHHQLVCSAHGLANQVGR
jgi:MFS superfamily sulfate permease-like transporter